MTWPELRGHLRERNRRAQARAEGQVTDPDTWAGAERDPFFASHFQRRAGGRRG